MDIVKEYRNQVEVMAEAKDKATEKTQKINKFCIFGCFT